jgi:hypothetical protein
MTYCEKCRIVLDDDQIIPGVTYAEDRYDLPRCGECNGETLIELQTEELCLICGDYHAEGYGQDQECAEAVYNGHRGELWALRYIMASGIEEAMSLMEIHDMGIKKLIMSEAKEFVEYYNESEREKAREELKLCKQLRVEPSPSLKAWARKILNKTS